MEHFLKSPLKILYSIQLAKVKIQFMSCHNWSKWLCPFPNVGFSFCFKTAIHFTINAQRKYKYVLKFSRSKYIFIHTFDIIIIFWQFENKRRIVHTYLLHLTNPVSGWLKNTNFLVSFIIWFFLKKLLEIITRNRTKYTNIKLIF